MATKQLTEISGIGPRLAERLRAAGFDSVDDVANAAAADLLAVPGIGPATAVAIREQAGAGPKPKKRKKKKEKKGKKDKSATKSGKPAGGKKGKKAKKKKKGKKGKKGKDSKKGKK